MILRRTLAAATLLTAVAIPAAHADQATLTISGRVLPGTCVLNVSPVRLPDVKANELVDRENQLTNSVLNLTSCVGVTRAMLAFDGTAESFDAELWKNTATSSAATGVSFVILQGTSGTT